MTHCILVFESTHQVLKAEKVLLQGGIHHDIIPTPKDLSSDCGMSIRIVRFSNEMDPVLSLLETNNILTTLYERKHP